MARSWESSPWTWFGIVVISGVTTAVVSAALQKWWGLKLTQKNMLAAQAQAQSNLGKYQAVHS